MAQNTNNGKKMFSSDAISEKNTENENMIVMSFRHGKVPKVRGPLTKRVM